MEVVGGAPPPLPPKTRKFYLVQAASEGAGGSKLKNSSGFYATETVGQDRNTSEKNGFEVGSFKIFNDRHRDSDGLPSPSEFVQARESRVMESQFTKTTADVGSGRDFQTETTFLLGSQIGRKDEPKIITWAGTGNRNDNGFRREDTYENFPTEKINYFKRPTEDDFRKVVSEHHVEKQEENQKKKKTPKIEVRQEENKTVVKILIKDNSTPEEEMNGDNRFKPVKENVYENGYHGSDGFRTSDYIYSNSDRRKLENEVVYENSNLLNEEEKCYERVSGGPYENVYGKKCEEQLYENLGESMGHCNRGPKKELITEANYDNLNEGDSECDQVYKNHEFHVGKNNVVNIIGKNRSERKERDDESSEKLQNDYRVYANEYPFRNGQKNAEKCRETAEKCESRKKELSEAGKKSTVIDSSLGKPERSEKVDKIEYENVVSTVEEGSRDPFDSGICSDADTNSPAAIQARKGNVVVTVKSLRVEEKADETKKESGHGRAESLTSSGVGVDSERSDDETSNISCDSLNGSEPYARSNSEDHGYHTPNSEDKTGSPVDRMEYDNLIKTAELKIDPNEEDYRTEEESSEKRRETSNACERSTNRRTESDGIYLAEPIESADLEEYEYVSAFEKPTSKARKPAPPPPPSSKPSAQVLRRVSRETNQKSLPASLLRDIRFRSVRLASTHPNGGLPEEEKERESKEPENDVKRSMVDERTYEERKNETRIEKVNKICAMEVDTDKFYKFHLFEKIQDDGKKKENGSEEETFAGIKDYLSREKSSAITSAKGTIRGVKNRVKAGIATFLQLHENKFYKDRDAGKVVVYTTTMGIVRETYQKCLKVKQILRTLMVKFEERDVFMSSEAQEEIRERMKCDVILVPQVFVEGQHIGGAETIERLNEMGELRTILKPYKSADACSTCKVCGGYRLLPCSVCKGSKKSIHRNHFTAEFVSLKCMYCDQVGLTRCNAC